MYKTIIDDRELMIKPMNCPGHVQIYNQGIKSYKDLTSSNGGIWFVSS